MKAKIIAVDFDGTLIEEGKWPGLGYYKDEQLKILERKEKTQ